jgi:hypothetical protein
MTMEDETMSVAASWKIEKGFGWTTDRKTYGAIWNVVDAEGKVAVSVSSRNWAKQWIEFHRGFGAA